MTRSYDYKDINEMGLAHWYIDGIARPRFANEIRRVETTNNTLLNNFFKCAEWIAENCPTLNGTFNCKHEPYHWTRIVVEDGKAYLEYGSHGWGFDTALSTTETAIMSRGSMQRKPYAFNGIHFFRNDALEEFLSQWGHIKKSIIYANKQQSDVFSEEFVA
jgi:hypothetical protein